MTLAAVACAGLLKGETACRCAEVEKLREPFRDWMARVRVCCMARERASRRTIRHNRSGEWYRKAEMQTGCGEKWQALAFWTYAAPRRFISTQSQSRAPWPMERTALRLHAGKAMWGSPTSDGSAYDMSGVGHRWGWQLGSERCKFHHRIPNGHGAMGAFPEAAMTDDEVPATVVTCSCRSMAK
jgi:hypothetical protein